MKVVLLICILIDIILFNFIMYLYLIFFLTYYSLVLSFIVTLSFMSIHNISLLLS